jgi:hypothetical protein
MKMIPSNYKDLKNDLEYMVGKHIKDKPDEPIDNFTLTVLYHTFRAHVNDLDVDSIQNIDSFFKSYFLLYNSKMI